MKRSSQTYVLLKRSSAHQSQHRFHGSLFVLAIDMAEPALDCFPMLRIDNETAILVIFPIEMKLPLVCCIFSQVFGNIGL